VIPEFAELSALDRALGTRFRKRVGVRQSVGWASEKNQHSSMFIALLAPKLLLMYGKV